jgi:hypothetical protein
MREDCPGACGAEIWHREDGTQEYPVHWYTEMSIVGAWVHFDLGAQGW